MNIENGDERLLRAERERDEARAEVARLNAQNKALAATLGAEMDEVARLRERTEMAEQERDKVTRQLNSERADHVRIAVALGTFYESDYSGPVRAPVDVVVREIEALVKDRTAADRLRSLDQAVLAYRRKERALLGLPDGALEEDHLQAIARLRASQNERAIAEVGRVRAYAWNFQRTTPVIAFADDRIAALRAEAQAAPAKEPVPAEPAAPQGPSVEELRDIKGTLDRQDGCYEELAISALRIAVRLLLDAEIARRGGAS